MRGAIRKVKAQVFPANEMNHDARRVVAAGSLAFVRRLEFLARRFGVENDALENFAEHFRVNGHFLRQRRVFADGEVVSFEQIVKERKSGVGALVIFDRRYRGALQECALGKSVLALEAFPS